VVGFCELGDEHSGSIKAGNFLSNWTVLIYQEGHSTVKLLGWLVIS
jgi:hypothetical protein